MPITSLENDTKSAATGLRIQVASRMPSIEKQDSLNCTCPIIKAEGFGLYYGSKVGVKDITMDVNPCSVTAIIGV